jgi:hypothetical protein
MQNVLATFPDIAALVECCEISFASDETGVRWGSGDVVDYGDGSLLPLVFARQSGCPRGGETLGVVVG